MQLNSSKYPNSTKFRKITKFLKIAICNKITQNTAKTFIKKCPLIKNIHSARGLFFNSHCYIADIAGATKLEDKYATK